VKFSTDTTWSRRRHCANWEATLSFETVEHSARYAQELVKKNFPAPLF
jgi:hypothetical protein